MERGGKSNDDRDVYHNCDLPYGLRSGLGVRLPGNTHAAERQVRGV